MHAESGNFKGVAVWAGQDSLAEARAPSAVSGLAAGPLNPPFFDNGQA